MLQRISLTLFAVLVLVGISSTARAEGEECMSDEDCAEGEACIMVPCAMPCDPDESGACEDTCEPIGMCLIMEDDPFESECVDDEDCPEGFVCEEIGGVACAVSACPEGVECPDPPECEEEIFYGCVPAPCSSDEDCGEGLICLTVTYEMCSGMARPDCSPEEEDCWDDGGDSGSEEPTCETYTESFCAPPYLAPCTEDADCGEGFRCVEAEMCVCEGGGVIRDESGEGGGSGSSDPDSSGSTGEEETDPEWECTCEPSGEFYCEPQEITCDSDEDCPEGWTCEDFGGVTLPCIVEEGGEEPVCEEEPEEIPDMCLPPFWGPWGADGDREGYSEALEEASGGTDARAMPRVEENGERPDVRVEGGSGCQVVGDGSPWAACLMGLFALGLTLRRRK